MVEEEEHRGPNGCCVVHRSGAAFGQDRVPRAAQTHVEAPAVASRRTE